VTPSRSLCHRLREGERFIPTVDEAGPELLSGTDGWGDFELVAFTGFAEGLKERAAVVEVAGGGQGFGTDVAVDFDAEGKLENLGGSTGAAIEGAVAEEGFDARPAAPGRDNVGVAADVFDGQGFRCCAGRA